MHRLHIGSREGRKERKKLIKTYICTSLGFYLGNDGRFSIGREDEEKVLDLLMLWLSYLFIETQGIENPFVLASHLLRHSPTRVSVMETIQISVNVS